MPYSYIAHSYGDLGGGLINVKGLIISVLGCSHDNIPSNDYSMRSPWGLEVLVYC